MNLFCFSPKQEWLAVTYGKMELVHDEQFTALKFCIRLQKSTAFQQAYGKDVLPQPIAFRWFKQFKEGVFQPPNRVVWVLQPMQ